MLYPDETGCRITVDSDGTARRGLPGRLPPGTGSMLPRQAGSWSPAAMTIGAASSPISCRMRSASMTTSVGGEAYGPCYYYLQSSMDQNANQFGFYLFPLELSENGELAILEEVAAQAGLVTVDPSPAGQRHGHGPPTLHQYPLPCELFLDFSA